VQSRVAYVPPLLFHSSSELILGLENYGSVLRDCAAVITTNSSATKAYYRAGLALLALERADEALDVCTRAGVGVADDARFRTLRARAEKKREELRRKEKDRREQRRRVKEEKRRMDAAFAVSFILSFLPFVLPFLTAHSLNPHLHTLITATRNEI
jgi:hypothetical protein